MPLAFGEVAVENRDLLLDGGKAALEPLNGLRRQRNLRDKHDGALPPVEHALDRLKVNLRLTASGHAMEQQRLLRLVEGAADRFKDGALLGVERQRRGRDKRIALVRVAGHGFRFGYDHPFAHQRGERAAIGAGFFEQRGDRHRAKA